MNFSTGFNFVNVTTVTPPTARITPTLGLIACLLSSAGFGINYLPVKKYETGDGMFFQWIISTSIFLGSFCVAFYLKFPTFHPLVMIGGFLWSTGNICVVPVTKTIGLGMGFLIWGSASNIFGWASGRFGWFGIDPQLPKNFTLNYIGFSIVVISSLLYALVRVSLISDTLDGGAEFEITSQEDVVIKEENSVFRLIKRSCGAKSKLIGISLSVLSGALYGFSFIPVMYVKNRYNNSSQQDIDYLFAQCSGIYLSSTLYFIIYCIVKCNAPILYPKIILPAMMSGAIWIFSYVCFFIAIEPLSPAICQPIVVAVSGVLSTVINVTIFREVKGIRNYVIIMVAIALAITGSTLVGVSKIW